MYRPFLLVRGFVITLIFGVTVFLGEMACAPKSSVLSQSEFGSGHPDALGVSSGVYYSIQGASFPGSDRSDTLAQGLYFAVKGKLYEY